MDAAPPGLANLQIGILLKRAATSLLYALTLLGLTLPALAQQLDQGIPELRAAAPGLTGSGVAVIQAEAIFTGNNDWEVDPASVGQPADLFTYISASGTSTTYPNSLGILSGHADNVADNFYGDNDTANPEGIAPGISQIYNYEADYFANSIILPLAAPIPAEIVNQSFEFILSGTTQQAQIDQAYDNYAATYGTLFISGAGNGGLVGSPASAYNGIAVGAYLGSSSSGNYDGRSKPDIVAYPIDGDVTSYAAPLVSAAAAILLQAAQQGCAGTSPQVEAAAQDARVLKALLLNGATKPPGWKSTVANPTTTPLDPVTGAGLLNVYNSYQNLAAGEQPFSTTLSGPVSPVASPNIEPDEGWDLETMANTFSPGSGTYLDQSNHYTFDLSAATAPEFTLTATLIWWRELNQTNINNFYLYLFDTDTDTTIAASLSTIDNVQELYIPDLAPGDYDLAVVKSGSAVVSATDTYALAFAITPVPEPATLRLLTIAFAVLASLRRRSSS
jgi:hypothetical protein